MIVHLLLIGEMPTPAELRASGIKTGPSGGKGKEKASPLLEAMEKFRKAGVEGGVISTVGCRHHLPLSPAGLWPGSSLQKAAGKN